MPIYLKGRVGEMGDTLFQLPCWVRRPQLAFQTHTGLHFAAGRILVQVTWPKQKGLIWFQCSFRIIFSLKKKKKSIIKLESALCLNSHPPSREQLEAA